MSQHEVSIWENVDFSRIGDEMDKRIKLAEVRIIGQIKVWFLTGLLGLLATSIVGFASMMFFMGKITERFDTQMVQMTSIQTSRTNVGQWMDRKDALDDDVIRWAKSKGYTPPSWYVGKDSDATGK
jgi:hypothetical protein